MEAKSLLGSVGPAASLTDDVVGRYCRAFLNTIGHNGTILVGHDLRPSSRRIARALAAAAVEQKTLPVNCGVLPVPALALAAATQRTSAIMVGAAQASQEVNGLQFLSPQGALSGYDEARVGAAFSKTSGREAVLLPQLPEESQHRLAYVARFVRYFSGEPLRRRKIGVYLHSATSRDLLPRILSMLGAEVVPLGRSEEFLHFDPGDPDRLATERARNWVREHRLDALVGTSALGDRPYLVDDQGEQVAGDLVAAFSAVQMGATSIIAAASVNSVLERLGGFERIVRVASGPQAVLERVRKEQSRGKSKPYGIDADGGVVLGYEKMRNGKTLTRLNCKDGVLPVLSALVGSAEMNLPISELIGTLPARAKLSTRIRNLPWPLVARLLRSFRVDAPAPGLADLGHVVQTEPLSGMRVTFCSGLVVHFEPRGGSSQLYCHVEAADRTAAEQALSYITSNMQADKLR